MTAEKATAVLAGILCCGVLVSARQAIQLEFNDGRVWLLAHDAPVRDILREWARVGGATIVNGDAVEGAPVTLELAGVPERGALEMILRDVPGYVLAARPIGSPGSVFARILILAKTTIPLPPAPVAAARRPLDAAQPSKGLPEPLAVLLPDLDNVTGVDRMSAEAVEPETNLPDDVADILRAITNAASAETAPRPSRLP